MSSFIKHVIFIIYLYVYIYIHTFSSLSTLVVTMAKWRMCVCDTLLLLPLGLPAVSHHVAVGGLDDDVLHVKQHIHEVLTGHGPVVRVLPLMLKHQGKKNNKKTHHINSTASS